MQKSRLHSRACWLMMFAVLGAFLAPRPAHSEEARVVVLQRDGDREELGPGERFDRAQAFTLNGEGVVVVGISSTPEQPDFRWRLPNGTVVELSKKKIAEAAGTTTDRVTIRELIDMMGNPVGYEFEGTTPSGGTFKSREIFPDGTQRLSLVGPPPEPSDAFAQAAAPAPIAPTDEAEILDGLGLPDDPGIAELVEAVGGEVILGSAEGLEQVTIEGIFGFSILIIPTLSRLGLLVMIVALTVAALLALRHFGTGA